MNSSGIKRGVAATAISALAVTGLPFLASTATAQPANSQVANADSVYLVSPETDTVSAQNDGQNTTVRLEAIGGNNVPQVRFQYSLNGGTTWTTIATVGRNDNGAFSHEWDATPVAGAPAVELRAVSFVSGAVVDVTNDDNSQEVAVNNTDASVNITDGTGVGVFQQPYGDNEQQVIVSGTASAGGNPTSLSFWDTDSVITPGVPPDPDVLGPGYTEGTVDIDDTTPDDATTDSWTGVLDITGYNYAGAPDELVVNAANDDTDDAESFGLYVQTITSVTAEAENTNVPAGSDDVTVTVTVLDQNQRPIAGARVVASDDSDSDFTDANGQVELEQGAGTVYYYADATSQTGYQNQLGDRRSADITVTEYAAEPTALTADSDNGAAFDVQEYQGNDITVQVNDQNDNAIDTTDQDLEYYWVFTPFGGGDAVRTPAEDTNSVDGADSTDGEYEVPLPAGYAAQSGTYELYAGLSQDSLGNNDVDSSKVLTVKAGDSDINFDGSGPAVAPAGGEATIAGALELADGTGLAGRPITLTYAGAGNAAFDQATGPDAPTRTVTTDADGRFSATLDDPTADPQVTETGAVTAETDDYTDESGDTDNAVEEATKNVVFAQSEPPAGSTVEITEITGNGTPGVARSGEVTVETAAGAPIGNQVVTLTIDGDSFFTDGSAEDADAEEGDEAGDLSSEGQTIQVVTEADGTADFMFAVERSEEFDDDGLAEDIVTAAAGSVSDTEDVDYSSANPLNPGAVDLVFAPASEQDAGNNPPTARPGSEVEIDVFAEDQFGNLVGGEPVTISDNTVDAEIIADDADSADGIQVLSNFDDDGDFSVTADEEETQTVTGSWTQATTVYEDDDADSTEAGPNETVTDTITVNYSDATITDETVTMTSNAGDLNKVGTAVTETVTVLDEEGNPVPNTAVAFTRQGPGNADDSVTKYTNSNGRAFYTFVGTEDGTAYITAVVDTGAEPVVKTDTVEFGDKKNPGLVVKGYGHRAGNDDVIANARNTAAGGKVKLYRKTKRGNLRKIAVAFLNDRGNHKFNNIKDKNGRKKTKYKVILKPTSTTDKGKGGVRLH